MTYISELTEFRAYEPPYTDKIYIKDGNKTVCIIHADENWSMYGDVVDPFNIPISPIKPIYTRLNQFQCERIIMRNMPPMIRVEQLKREYGFDKVDYAIVMYRTRLITLIDTYWAAWSEEDKAEDYHPRFNAELMKQRFEGQIEIDPEEEDKYPMPPWSKCEGYLFDGVDELPEFDFED